MKKIALTFCAVLMSLVTSDAKPRKVLLNLDYSRQMSWGYVLDYHSECVIVDTDSTSRIKTQVLCDMLGKPSVKGDRFTFTINSVSVESQFYSQEQQQSIISKLTGADFSIALIRGCPVVDTLSTFSVSEISEWDLVIQFAKLLPEIPIQPVRKGYSWEQSGVFPVVTSLGKIPCEVYRLYTIDSLVQEATRAHISWRFRYAALRSAIETSNILKQVPVSGTGKGTAVIDVTNSSLLEAHVQFETPVARHGAVKINWVENTTLRYHPLTSK